MKRLRHVAAGVLGSFMCRNNDVAGYWAPGLLYRACGAEVRMRFNLLEPGAACATDIATVVARNYAEFLRRALIKQGLRLEQLAQADIELWFDADVAPDDAGRGWIGDPFLCTVTIALKDGKAASAQCIRRCARYTPGRFSRRAGSSDAALERLIGDSNAPASRLEHCRDKPTAGMRFFDAMNLRQATLDDIPAMSAIRLAVKENVLSDPSRVTAQMYRDYLDVMGRGWVVEVDGEVVGFCSADKNDASIWALFISPPYEGRGIAKRLLRVAVDWLFALGHESVHLSTSKDTRADKFYTSQGWTRSVLNDRDAGFRLTRTPPA
jgi:GNAT superfamily N-acetyltransferase